MYIPKKKREIIKRMKKIEFATMNIENFKCVFSADNDA